MNNFFCNHKTQKSDPEHTFSEIDINYRRDYSKGKSFKVSIWNEIDTYNNDDFIQDFVIYNQSLWARIDSTPSTNEVPTEGPWTKVMDGVSDVQFKEEGNKIFWKYEDESEWKDLFELDIVSESEIKNMLKDIATDVDSNFYDKTLSETSINAVQNKVITQALNKKADKTELSKKQDVISDLSEIRNKAKSALQSVPSEYVTESELANKGYLTEHQDISGKQDKIADLAQIRANAQKGATALQTVPSEYATKTDVSNEVAKIVNSAPKAFDTLKEIADWIEEDAEPAIVLANKVEQKVDKVEGLGLSEENYTAEDKEKLEGLENYDDSVIKKDLANKADKSEIPTRMSQLEQDIEVGSGYDDTEVKNELARLEREKADKSELTELSAEVSGLSERIDNLPSGESSVFEAVFGETTHAEVLSAFKEGKHCLCVRNSLIHNLVYVNETGDLLFTCVNQVYVYTIMLKVDNAWYNTIYTIEKNSNKVTSLSSASTDTQYPSAKAVYDALQNVGGGSDVFVAEYGATTFEEIKTAAASKKIVYCYYNNMCFVLSILSSNEAIFSASKGNYLYTLACNYKNEWSGAAFIYSHELKTLDNGNVQVTIAGKTAEVATPQYVENAIQQSGGGGDDRLARILAGQSNFIVFEDVDGKMNIVNASLGGYKMAEFGAKVKRVITCGLNGVSGSQSASLFGGNVYQQTPCVNIESIDCIISFPSTCTSARRAFAQLKRLSSIDVSLFDTSNCTDFMMMFENTESLKYLDLTNLNTSKGEGFSSMFYRCFSPRIDMPAEGLDLRKATKVTGMFSEGVSGDECPHNRSVGLLNVTGNTAIEQDTATSTYNISMFGPYLYKNRNKITHLDGLRGLCVSLYLGWCKLLDNESVYNVINEATGGSEDAHIVITFATEQYNYAVSNAEIMAMCEEKFIDIVQG